MKKNKPITVPDDVYVQFVRSLFNNVHTVFVGALIHTAIALLAFSRNGEPIYAWLAALMFAIGMWRYASMMRVKSTGIIETREQAAKAERDYIIRGTIQGVTLGFFCFTGLYLVRDPFAELAGICVTMGSIVTVAGRNYGSPRMVAIFTIAFILPIGLGLVMRGDPAHIGLGLIVIPLFFIVIGTANQVREVLFSAVIGHRKANQLAQRFDRALNTMSHGLVMLDREGRVLVANAEAGRLMSAAPGRLLGRSLKSLMMRGVAAGLLSSKNSGYVEAQLSRALREGRDRKVLVSLNNGRHYEFSAREGHDEIGVITFEDVTTRVEAEEKVRYMARFDGLTGLPNRTYFQELLSEFMSVGDRTRFCGLAIIDLDDFKTINDTLGHPVGDGLICAVAQRLSAFADDNVKISRFGGDEFMIYIDSLNDEDEFEQILDRVFTSLQQEADVAGHALRIQASSGAVVCCIDQTDIEGMFVKADLALYRAKELGKNGWQLFEAKLDAEFRNKQLLKADLRATVEARGLRVVYQPIVSMDTMRIASCEALCRWDHPDLGPISPSVFIPLAEEMGIISAISRFMLAAACAECARWPEPLRVSVNLSARDFRSRDIIQAVAQALAQSGLAPHRLEIEVTETALLDDRSSTREFLEELKRTGVRIALDDFGTGYSSLSYLHSLPLDRVKIDRSFLADVTRNKRSLDLLKGIVDLCRPLGLAVTVEGVEAFEQLKILAREVKPDLVQGFLFGSALTGAGILTMANTVWPFTTELKAVKRAARG